MALLSTARSATIRWFWRGALAIALALAAGQARAQPAPQEYQIKAVFLFNFAQFVEWPPAAFADAKAPIEIGILGEDPFGSLIDDTVRGEIINHRPLVVRRFAHIEDVDHCHLLFVSRSESKRLDQVLAALRGRPILTVGDTEGFALRGVMIRFVTDKNRIRLRINLESAKAAGLTMSSKLLRPAEIVTTREN